MARPKKGEEHPKPDVANRIRLMTAIGTPHADIARALKISTETIHKHYKDELECGATDANTVVGGKIYEAAKRGEQWACALWAARRMKWTETSQVNLANNEGGPLQPVLNVYGSSGGAGPAPPPKAGSSVPQ